MRSETPAFADARKYAEMQALAGMSVLRRTQVGLRTGLVSVRLRAVGLVGRLTAASSSQRVWGTAGMTWWGMCGWFACWRWPVRLWGLG